MADPLIRGSALLLVLGLMACASHRSAVISDYGVLRCPAHAAAQLLSTDALQCWFDAPHGRWRTLSHESHYAVLVVTVEAADLRDAETIARRFVSSQQQTFSEILIYVQPEVDGDDDVIRRIRWTGEGGFEQLEFDAPSEAETEA